MPISSFTRKFCWFIQSMELDFHGKGFVSHRTASSSSSLCGREWKHSGDLFTDCRVGEFAPVPGEPDGSSALVLNSGFCYFMNCPGVLLFHPWCDASPLQITCSIFQVALTLARTICNSSVETQASILPKSTAWPPWLGFDCGFIKPESTEWATRLWHFMLWPQSVLKVCFRGGWQRGLEPSFYDRPS